MAVLDILDLGTLSIPLQLTSTMHSPVHPYVLETTFLMCLIRYPLSNLILYRNDKVSVLDKSRGLSI